MRPKKLSWFNQEIIFLILVIIFSNFIMFCRGGSDNNIFWIQGYAGNGYVGYSNYNSTDATSALIGQPYNVWMNSNGDIFFPDSINHRISKISGGIISTVVGTAWGSGGFTSNTAKALYSRLNSPQSVWGDTKGNLYIADTSNHRIRFFNISSGILSSVAGTGTGASSPDNRPALNITLNSPSGVFGDTNGNIFLTDTNNYRVRKVAAGTSIITTIMGNGTSGFAGDGSSIAISSMVKSPTGLFLDTNGNLYIADKSNNRVRMISSAGVFSTVAGTGSGGSTGDNGPATSAKINNPNCIWVDSLGNIFISDTNGNKIRRVSAGTNIITTYAGTGTVGYNGEMKLANITMLAAPYGVWGDTTGAIIVADRLNRRIRKISYPQRTFSLVAGTYDIGDGGQVQNAKLYNPYNINSDTTGLVLFITDGGNCRIRKVNLTSSVITTYGGTSTCGLSGDNGPVSSAQISGPRSMYVDSLSNLYFTDSANYRVRKVSSATNIITNIMGSNWGAFAENVTATAAKFQGLSGIWVDSNGHVFVTDSSFNRIVRWNAKSNFVNNFAGTGTGGALGDGGLATLAQLKSPQGLWGDSNLKLFIVDSGNYKIRVLNLATNIITTFAGVGVSSTLDKVPALNAKFSSPTGIIGDKYGNFYVMDNTRIRLLSKVNDTLWIVSTVIGTGSSGGNNVGGVATLSQIGQTTGLWIDSNYNFYLAETGYNRVRMAYQISNPTGQPSREPTGQPSRQPYSLPTGQPTRAPSGQPTKQPFSLPTGQPSRQPTTQPTSQPTREPTGQPSRQPSSQPTAQPTQSPSRQPTTQPTRDPTGQPTRTPSTQPTSKPSSQPSTQPSSQPTTCPSMQPSVQPTQAPSSQPTSRPTSQPSSPPIAAPSSHPTTQPFSVPSGQPLSQPTRIPSAQPFGFPSSQPSTQPSANPSTQPTSQPSKGPSSQPSCQPSSFPSTQPTAQPSSHPSSPPSRLPSTKPSKSPSCQPTVLPTAQPSNQPSVLPTTHPTSHPSTMSSSQPTSRPSAPPSAQPFTRPTSEPSSLPSVLPTTLPTRQPTSSPSSHPSNNPTPSPSGFPTTQPTSYPSQIPSTIPTMKPSNLPTANPTSQPSLKPSLIPTCRPSCLPTSFPSNYPSGQPTGFPTTLPSAAPTDFPTIIPSSTPTSWPTVCPSAKPTILPTTIPTISPVSQPSHAPLAVPTALPSTVPSLMPSMYPIGFPSGQPTQFPVVLPRIPPSVKPTTLPSGSLLTQPSICPTSLPSYTPIALPTGQPAMNPSTTPSSTPIDIPTSRPTTLSSSFIIKSSSPSPACSPSVALTFPPSPFSAQPTSLFHLPSHLPTELPVCWSPSLIPSGMPISLYPSYSPSTALPTRPIQSSTRPSLTPSLRPSTGNPSRSPTLSPSLYPTVESSSSNDTLPFDFLSSAIIMPDGYSRFQQVLFLFSPLSRDSNVYKNINVPAPSLGNSFVVFGTTDPVRAFTNISLWSDETQTEFVTVGAGLSIEGSQRAVSLLGDINHDNHEDFVIGNPFQNEVYVVLGSQTKVKYGFTVRGEVAGDNLGWSVSSAGDFNGDGFRDVLVSAWQSGRCYVIYGKASGFKDVWLSTLESVDGLRIIGGNDTSNLGIAVSGAGDFNGDGRDDILLTGRGPLGDNVVYLVYGMKNGGSRVSLDLNGLTTQMGLRIKAPRFSFAGLSLAGVGDVNGDGYADVCIGSVPYKNGYSRQESYIVYGNRSEVNVDMYLEDLMSSKRGRKIEGGGIVVMGAGDVDGDEIDDILVINYDDWASSPGSFIITVPNHGVSRHPTLFPSSHPSVSTPQPSNFPSSSPSQRVVVIVPTLSTNDTRTPTILKTTRPSLFPTLRPTRKPSSMTQNPSPVPTIATNTPSLAPSSIRPSIKPSRSPTASPSVNRQPTSLPSSSPTLSMSQPWVTTEITSGGFYVGSHRREVFVVDSEGNVVIRGIEGGRSIYKILPRANVTITILNFHNNQDIIDLSEFSSLTWLGDLSYQTYPLVLLLGSAKDQTVVLSSHNEFDLSDSNFIFNQNGNSNRGDTSAGSSSSSVSLSSISFNAEVISFFGVIGGLVLLSFCFCHAITHIERVGKTKKAARLKARISQSLHTLPDKNTRELSNLQSPLSPILEGQGEDSPAARSIFLQFSPSTRMPSKASNSHSSSSASSNSMNSGASSGHRQEESVSDSVDGSSSSNQEDNDDEEDEEDVDESQSSYASFSSFDSFEQA